QGYRTKQYRPDLLQSGPIGIVGWNFCFSKFISLKLLFQEVPTIETFVSLAGKFIFMREKLLSRLWN
ncbi:MAG: hypothetical protein V8T12_09970, partial [Parabacteroides johnsonii]